MIEILVAVFVFILVIGAVVGLLVSTVQSQGTIIKEQKVASETSYVVEYMSRALRMAQRDDGNDCLEYTYPHKYNYELIDAVGEYGPTIRFLNYDDICQEFYLEDNKIYERKSSDKSKSNLPLSGVVMTSSNISVEELFFHKGGSNWHLSESTDGNQSKVTISMRVGYGDERTSINLQTTVSQRNLNVPRKEEAE